MEEYKIKWVVFVRLRNDHVEWEENIKNKELSIQLVLFTGLGIRTSLMFLWTSQRTLRLLVSRGISCVAEQLLCGKQSGVPALIVLSKSFIHPIMHKWYS